MLSSTSLLQGQASSSTTCKAGPRHCPVVHASSSNANSSQRPPIRHAPLSAVSCDSPHSIRHQQQAPSTCRRFHTLVAAAAAATGAPGSDSPPNAGPDAAADADADADDVSSSYLLTDEPGPAFQDTLGMLEWQRLCEHLARHSSTTLGRRLCLRMTVPLQEATSMRLQQEVSAVFALESTYTTLLDFGGINSGDAEGAIKRADKGGMVSAKQLRGLVTLLEGADRLKRQVALVARQNHATGPDSPLRPLLDVTGAVVVPRGLMGAITAAIQEDGELADNASEQVRTTRARVRALTSRATNLLKGYPGEPSEKGGRICVAAPAGTKISNGVLLGTSVGGGMVYIEPGTVVSLNNELMSARAEALSAEEAVLWDLSARLMGVLDDVQQAFDTVGWLDLTAAKVRFGLWLGGVLPTFTPWEQVFERRPPGAPFGAPLPPSSGPRPPPAVSLQGLSHPLLLADYQVRRQKLEHQAQISRLASTAAGSSGSSGSGSGGQRRGSAGRVLGTRKDVMARRLSSREASALLASMESGEQQEEDDSGLTPEQQLQQLQPPRPIDINIQPETAVVVITGPNTGGKTATMKALGLAACMAKCGLMLPAAAPARLPCFSSVLADIGDEQSLTASLSTFSGHIKRISSVRHEADGWSLLLLDELGTGTDPTEGAALGQALLKTLVRGGPSNGALTVATTHHSIMTGLKFDDGRVENASVEFDEEKLGPTYKLLWGIPGRSNALNIAARLGLDPAIVQAARQRLAVGVAAANAAIEELEAVQQELREADMVLFAVTANAQETKERVLQARELNAQRQKELLFKRVAALQEVLGAARPLVKALKEERKARIKKGDTTNTRVTRLLDTALGESLKKQPAKSLESALQAFDTLTGSGSSSGSSAGPQAAAAEQQQQYASEPWVRTWMQLLSRARATLASSLLLGGEEEAGGSGGAASSSGSNDAAEAAAELEKELEDLRQKEAAAAAAKDAEVQAAQQLLNEMFQQVVKQQGGREAAEGAAAGGGDAAAGAAGEEGSSGGHDGSGQQQRKRRKATFEEEVDRLAVVEGISLLEDALDSDADLWDTMQQQQAALAEQQAAEEQQRQQAAAAAAAELAQLEQQFVEEFEEFELDWYTAAAAAAEAADAEEQRRQQEAAAAAQAAREQQQRQQAAQEQQRRQQQEADLQLLRAFEEGGLDDLEDLESLLLSQSSSSSSSSQSSSSQSSSSSTPELSSSQPSAAGGAGMQGSPSGSNGKAAQPQPSPSPPSKAAAAAAGSFDPDALLEELLSELPSSGPEPWMQAQQQQQQQQPGGKKGRTKQQPNPVFKFKK